MFEKYLSGRYVSLAASCTGGKDELQVVLEPGGESVNPMCYPSGVTTAWAVDGPSRFPYPTRVLVRAPARVRWSLIIVVPGTSPTGFSELD